MSDETGCMNTHVEKQWK